jgi:hypothetical protein
MIKNHYLRILSGIISTTLYILAQQLLLNLTIEYQFYPENQPFLLIVCDDLAAVK